MKNSTKVEREPIDIEKLISDACEAKAAEDEKYFSGCQVFIDVPDDERPEMQGLEEGHLFGIERTGLDID